MHDKRILTESEKQQFGLKQDIKKIEGRTIDYLLESCLCYA